MPVHRAREQCRYVDTLSLFPAPAPATSPADPILKWVGGKKRMLGRVLPHYTGQSTVVEPFFGGGALSFHIAGRHPDVTVVANDRLAPLIDIYDAIRGDVDTFIAEVEQYALPYLAKSTKPERRLYYYSIRDKYMTGELDGPAVLFFMLRCAYSGLYRTGKTYPGRFNTSHGFGTEQADFYHTDRLRAAAALMQNWQLTAADFQSTLTTVGPDSFVFLDPPYRQTYTGYTDEGFTDADQLSVVDYFKAADALGAKVVYTNKDTGDDFYTRHFSDYSIARVPIKYSVNSNCADVGRPTTYEVLVSN